MESERDKNKWDTPMGFTLFETSGFESNELSKNSELINDQKGILLGQCAVCSKELIPISGIDAGWDPVQFSNVGE